MSDLKANNEVLRSKIIDLDNKHIRLVRVGSTDQTKDIQLDTNFGGYGRIKSFKGEAKDNWPVNIIQLKEVCKNLSMPYSNKLKAQIFQLVGCDLRCWYCFVPNDSLKPNEDISDWVSAEEMIDAFVNQSETNQLIDLSGGNPALVPEWVLWMIRELRKRNIEDKVILWSEDNLSSDMFFEKLSKEEIQEIVTNKNYARLCCLKGYNEESFAFNTGLNKEGFKFQFERLKKLYDTGMIIYPYVTMTTPNLGNLKNDVKTFVDKLQDIDEKLPLRTILVQIKEYEITKERIEASSRKSLEEQSLINQLEVAKVFMDELTDRYSKDEIAENILVPTYESGEL
ncbi:MAG TPA: hypothetical protein DEP72_00935 [Clostridiales bacterium]|nr:MAG: hypothetical protein A2Y18_05030 [Clostridiales bacterium GWD2_32_19]HCC06718.1 hypothetical protein [Clostridiales bacterium]